MKTVKNRTTGEISRVKDELATVLVSQKLYVYVPKHYWKQEVRDTKPVRR